jgi:hypothetical protein
VGSIQAFRTLQGDLWAPGRGRRMSADEPLTTTPGVFVYPDPSGFLSPGVQRGGIGNILNVTQSMPMQPIYQVAFESGVLELPVFEAMHATQVSAHEAELFFAFAPVAIPPFHAFSDEEQAAIAAQRPARWEGKCSLLQCLSTRYVIRKAVALWR